MDQPTQKQCNKNPQAGPYFPQRQLGSIDKRYTFHPQKTLVDL
jgi:hypothetical protein